MVVPGVWLEASIYFAEIKGGITGKRFKLRKQ